MVFKFGDISSPDGTSAGDKFIEDSVIASVEDGKIDIEATSGVSLSGVNSIVGRSVIIYEKDDSGKMLAWGVVGITEKFKGGTTDGENINYAKCIFAATEKSPKVTGTALIKEEDGTLEVYAEFKGIKGIHGFHIHQYGDITADDGTAAGGHYNPHQKNHGIPPAEDRHVGDLGNIEDQEDEEVYTFRGKFENFIQLTGDHGVVGRAMILHEKEDDGSQPVGNAGSRYAQCVIGVSDKVDIPSPATNLFVPRIDAIIIFAVAILVLF